MDTRQLAAFCEVVERRSFSDAAARLGVTQPAVSQQVRALEQRLGTQLLDRSGRRVEPTEAGLRLYRGAQRMLAFEEQLLEELAEPEGPLRGTLEIGASTGPAAIVLPLLLCEFQRDNPDAACRAVGLGHAVGRRARRRPAARARDRRRRPAAPLGRVRAVLPRRGDPRLPARPSVRRQDGRARRAPQGPLILMQQGAGVRQMVEDELRKSGRKLRDLEAPLELGLQESVRSAVQAGYGVGFISRRAVESELAAGTLAEARVRGLDLARDIYIARAAGRAGRLERRAGVRRVRARAARTVIVRWGLEELPGAPRRRRDRAAAARRRPALGRARDPRGGALERDPFRPDRGPAGVDGILAVGGGSAIDTAKAASAASGLPLVSVPTTYSGAEWTGFFGVRTPERRQVGGGAGARLAGIVYDPELTLDLPRAESGGTALNALAHCVEALYPGELEAARRGAAGDRPVAPARARERARPRGAHAPAGGGERRGPGARRARPLPRPRDGAGGRRRATASRTAR